MNDDADIRVRVGWLDHHKTQRLERRLGPTAPTCLLRLWFFARVAKLDGDLAGMDDEAIEIAAKWGGEPGAFTRALVDLRWLDGPDGHRIVHEWQEHQGFAKAIHQRRLAGLKSAEVRRAKRGSAVPVGARNSPNGRSAATPPAKPNETTLFPNDRSVDIERTRRTPPAPAPAPAPRAEQRQNPILAPRVPQAGRGSAAMMQRLQDFTDEQARTVATAIRDCEIPAWRDDPAVTQTVVLALLKIATRVDVVAEVRACQAWWITKPATVRGRTSCIGTLRNWLLRANERGGSAIVPFTRSAVNGKADMASIARGLRGHA